MSLLLKTDIQEKIEKNICGSVARIGGSMQQIVNYKNCKVRDINIIDGGFGRVDKLKGNKSVVDKLKVLKKILIQEYFYYRYGEVVSRDRRTIITDMHYAYQNIKLKHKYDCSISSNIIEHSYNPILLLLNFYFITRKEGYQYHAIPHYKYTYDCHRNVTDMEHFIVDFENMTNACDDSHVKDYIQSAIIKDGWQKEFHKKYPVEYPYMHFHVFDEKNVRMLFEYIFEDVTSDVIRTNIFSDNIIICRNKLNKKFIEKYFDYIPIEYSLEN